MSIFNFQIKKKKAMSCSKELFQLYFKTKVDFISYYCDTTFTLSEEMIAKNKNAWPDYKLDKELWSILKTFVIYLERLPEFPLTALHDIPIDKKCLQLLNDL